jgi:hypothetical protein
VANDILNAYQSAYGKGKQAKPKVDRLAQLKQFLLHSQQSPVGKAVTEFGQLPAEGINALLGAPQRISASRIANFSKNPRGVAETAVPFLNAVAFLDPQGRKQIGNEIYAAFHPNDLSIEEAAERATGVNRLMTNDPRFRGKLRNFAVRTAFQTLTDPLNIATAGTATAGEMALRGIGRAGTQALRAGSPTARLMLTNAEERAGGFTPEEISTVNSIRNRDITRQRLQHTQDQALLRKHKGQLQRGQMPDEVHQRLLREAYIWGTSQMREDALKFGYKPTAAEAAKKPASILEYNVRENYDPQTKMPTTPHAFDELLLGEEKKVSAPKAGFELPQTRRDATPESLYQRVAQRLASGREVTRHRSTSRSLQEHLLVTPEMADSMARKTATGKIAPLQALSKAQVDALLTTGLPHMRNVGIMGYMAMGEKGIARAIQFMASGVPKALRDRLEEGGGASHFGVRVPGTYSPARLVPQSIRHVTTGALDRWDQALRAARLEQVDKELPKATEFEKMDRVNQDLGAYNLKPQYVRLLSGIGANFPQWHDYIALTATGRALLRNPGRVERLSRAEQNANDTFLPNSPYRITLGGPIDETASGVADLARIATGKYPSYFGGPSSLGPGSYALHPPPGTSPALRAIEAGATAVPFGPTLLDVLLNPYKSQLPPAARLAGGLTAIYSQKRPPGSRARTAQRPATTSGNPYAGFQF